MFSLFTPQEANKVLPEVSRKYDLVLTVKNKVIALQQEMQYIIEAGSPFDKFIKKKQELNSAVSNLYKAIEDLEMMGVMIKSVDDGLLDFPSRKFDDEIWLCWKAGETEIKFWHGKDEGFMGRKPLETKSLDDLR